MAASDEDLDKLLYDEYDDILSSDNLQPSQEQNKPNEDEKEVPPGSPLSDNPFDIESDQGEGVKRSHDDDDDEEEEDGDGRDSKRARVESDDNDDDNGGLENELADLQPQEEEVEQQREEEQRVSGDSDNENDRQPLVSDFDLMMQRRKEAMARARRRRKKDIDITTNDDHILAMIRQMKEAAEEDRALNLQQKAATKKLQMLPTVLDHLKKIDLLTSFIECGICSALADWLKPLPDHSLPHLKIRESILDVLKSFPTLDSHLLKISNLGKAVMLLYRHPKEIRKNKDKAGKIINTWARPVFGLTSDFKSLTRDEREERDWAHLTQAAKRRLSSDTRDTEQANDEYEPQKPGDKGWIGRARVPMPSNKDYVVRPKWNVQHEFSKGHSKKSLNRYEKHVQKKRDKTSIGKNMHAIQLSVEGRKMPL